MENIINQMNIYDLDVAKLMDHYGALTHVQI
jgi:hypothetical protein